MAPTTTRVELSNGGWADVHRMRAGDMRRMRLAAHDRGWADDQLDALEMIKSAVARWSLGEVTDEAVDQLSLDDVRAISEAITLGEAPSSPSSAGGTEGETATLPTSG